MPKKPKSNTIERQTYQVKGGKILVFGDLHLSAKYEGTHKNYLYECYYNMDRIVEICESNNPSGIVFLGDLIGVTTTNSMVGLDQRQLLVFSLLGN